MTLKKCTRCVMPETQDTIIFDEKGVCNICRNVEHKNTRIDWKKREQEFKELLEEYRGKGQYDCLVPFSGGKDSTWTLYKLVKDYKLKPLVVRFDHLFYRPNAERNNERTLKKLGVDFLNFKPSPHIVKKLMVEALRRKGDFCWHCHTGVFSFPMHMAIKFETPLIIWGEPSAEYTAYYSYENPEEVDEKRFNMIVNLGITAEDMVGMLDDPDITLRDLWPFQYPSLKDLRRIKYRSICLGSYLPWDTKTHSEDIRKGIGWQGDEVEGIPPDYWYEKIECRLQGVRDYLKFIKRGMGRTTHLASIDRRNERLTREEAERLVEEYDGKRPESLDYFLEITAMDEEEFNSIAAKNAIAPHKPDFASIPRGKKLKDQQEWEGSRLDGK